MFADEVAPILTVIFNTSYDKGEVPLDWKTAFVHPIFKKGSKKLPLNYRPISLTCVCSKIFEHILSSQINRFLDKENLICETTWLPS